MKEYGLKVGKKVSEALEVLGTELTSLERVERHIYLKYNVESKVEKEDYLSYIMNIYSHLVKVRSFSETFEEVKRPLTFTDLVLFIAQSKRRIKRRIERLKKTISRRFVDYRVIIRSFANKVIRRNTEEDYILCG